MMHRSCLLALLVSCGGRVTAVDAGVGDAGSNTDASACSEAVLDNGWMSEGASAAGEALAWIDHDTSTGATSIHVLDSSGARIVTMELAVIVTAMDESFIYAASVTGSVYAFSRADGSKTSLTSGDGYFTAVALPNNGTDRVLALDPPKGRVVSIHEDGTTAILASGMSWPTGLALVDNTAYIGDQGTLRAVDLASGTSNVLLNDIGMRTWALTASADSVYLARGDTGVWSVWREPRGGGAPTTIVVSQTFNGLPTSMAVDADYVYMTTTEIPDYSEWHGRSWLVRFRPDGSDTTVLMTEPAVTYNNVALTPTAIVVTITNDHGNTPPTVRRICK